MISFHAKPLLASPDTSSQVVLFTGSGRAEILVCQYSEHKSTLIVSFSVQSTYISLCAAPESNLRS